MRNRPSPETEPPVGLKDKILPYTIEQLHAVATIDVPRGEGWICEPGWNGIPAMIYIKRGGQYQIISLGSDKTRNFPEFSGGLKQISENHTLVLDAKIIFRSPKGTTNSNEEKAVVEDRVLQEPTPLMVGLSKCSLVAVDIAWLDDEDLREHTLIERKKILSDLLKELGSDATEIYPTPYSTQSHDALISEAKKFKFNDVIFKKADSKYKKVRNKANPWRKISIRKSR